MKWRAIFIPGLWFCLGATGFALVRLAVGGMLFAPQGEKLPVSAAVRPPTAGASTAVSDAAASLGPVDLLAFTGLSAVPVMDDIFHGTGLARSLRLAVFLRTAGSTDLAALVARCKERKITDPALMNQIWLRWVEVDREAALLADPGGLSVWWAWAKLDPAAAVAAAAKAKPENLRAVIRAIGQDDSAAAVRLLAEYPQADSPHVWKGIVEGMGKTNGSAAASLALERNLKPVETIRGWASREPEQALAWARSLPDPVKRRRALELAVSELIRSNPAAALREIGTMPPGRARTACQAEAIAALAITDAAAALSAAEGLKNPVDRNRSMADLAEALASRDPASALSILKGLSWHDDASTVNYTFRQGGGTSYASEPAGAEHRAITQLMRTVPRETATVLAAMPPERQAPLWPAIHQWVAAEPETASQWVRALPSGPARDTGIQGLADWLILGTPEPDYDAALAWGAAISAKELQMYCLQNVLERWKADDQEAALAAVHRLPLTEEQRRVILTNLNK